MLFLRLDYCVLVTQKKAEIYASELGTTNRDRQNLTFEQTEMAVFSISQKYASVAEAKVLISVDSTYNQGVIGLIAGRLMEKFHRPAIVIARGEKVSKASTRSIAGFNIIENLRLLQDLLINCGGHPMAAGFTIETEKIEIFKEKFEKLAGEVLNEEILTKKINVDCLLPLNILKESAIPLLSLFSPFGMANPEPVFLIENVEITNLRTIGQDGKHLKFLVKTEKGGIDAVGFGIAQKNVGLKNGDRVSLIFTTSQNSFNGRTSLQMKVKEIIT